jgi:hypothetical protein
LKGWLLCDGKPIPSGKQYDALRKQQTRVYELAVNGEWLDQIGAGGALALFLAAAMQQHGRACATRYSL